MNLRERLSRLRQERYFLEHKNTQVGEMIKGSYIRRFKPEGEKVFKSVKGEGIKGGLPGPGKLYGYITYLKDGVTRHKYIRQKNEGEAMELCQRYQRWCRRMARIREINRIMLKLLEQIAKIKTQEVEKYVQQKRVKQRNLKKTVTK